MGARVCEIGGQAFGSIHVHERSAGPPDQNTQVDTDASHYPYSDELLIGGMSCDGCAQNVANALNALDGVWATVTYTDHTARVRSKQPIDRGALVAAVKDAGYYVMTL